MSAPTGGGDHLDLEAIAETDEGLPDAATLTARQAHIATCTTCADAQVRLRTTRALVSTLPAEQMPAEVADRIDRALAAAGGTIVPLQSPRQRLWERRPALTGIAAGVAVLALVGVAVGVVRGGSDGGDSAGTADAPNSAGADQQALSGGGYPVTSSGRNYTQTNIPTVVPTLVRDSAGGATETAGGKAAAVPAPLRRLHDSRPALASCVTGLLKGGPTNPPLLVDFGRYAGKPATLVVLPGILAGHLDAWVVGPKCNATDVDLLFYRSIEASGG